MTTPILEPLLAAAPTSTPATRDAQPTERSFRDLLEPKRSDGDVPLGHSEGSKQPEEVRAVGSGKEGESAESQTVELHRPQRKTDGKPIAKKHEEETSKDEPTTLPELIVSAAAPVAPESPPEVKEVAEAPHDTPTIDVETTPTLSQLHATRTPTTSLSSDKELTKSIQPATQPPQLDSAELPNEPAELPLPKEVAEEVFELPSPVTETVVAENTMTETTTDVATTGRLVEAPAQPTPAPDLPLEIESPVKVEERTTNQRSESQLQPLPPSSSTTPVAVSEIVQVTAAPSSPPSKSPDGEKRSSKTSSEASARAQQAPAMATVAAVAEPIDTIATATATVEPPIPPATTTAPESSAPPAERTPTTPPLAATTDRLGTMLTQRRGKTTASGEGSTLTAGQQARLVARVAKAFDTARMRGEAEIRLRLSPPELGSLKLEVRMESGAMTARLEVETVAAQQALTDNLGTLRQRLAEQNIRVEQFDIDLMDRDQGNSPDSRSSPFGEQERRSPERSAGKSQAKIHSSPHSAATSIARSTAHSASGGLDVLI